MVQQSWRAAESADRRRWRKIRSILAAILLAALVVYLSVLLVVPFLHPHTHLFFLAASSSQPLAGPELDYLENDLRTLGRTAEELAAGGAVATVTRLDNLGSRQKMNNLTADLQQQSVGSSDVMIVYVCSAPVMLADAPHLLCGDVQTTTPDIAEAAYPVEDLLDRVLASNAAVKLLLMDTGRIAYDRRLGLLASRFPDRLREIVQATGDPSLWVLTSNRQFERSHVARSLEQSIFAYFLAHGLEGASDASGDGYVSVDELYRYVTTHVAALVQTQTDNLARQTPELLWGGGRVSGAAAYPRLLAVGSRRRQPEPERLSQSIAAASEASRVASYYGLVRTPTADELAYRATAGLRPGGRLGYVADQLLAPAISGLGQIPGKMAAGPSPAGKEASAEPPKAGGDETSGSVGAAAKAPAQGSPGAGEEPDGTAPAAQSGAGGEAESSASAKPDPQAEQRKQRDRMARLLAEAWRLRDRLRDRNSSAAVPFDQAPHLWRLLEQRLLRYDQQFRAGRFDESQLASQVERLVVSLRDLVEGNPLIPGITDPLVLRIADARFDAWPDPNACFSIGLAEFLARARGAELPEALRTEIDQFDAFLDRGEPDEFLQWVERSLPAEFERLQEFWLARRLALEAEAPWPDRQLALRTRRLGERVAAASLPCLPWVRDKIGAADRRRLSGERELIDRIGEDWHQRAWLSLNEAQRIYGEAEQDARDVIAARERSNDLAARSHDYIRWRWAAGRQLQTDVPGFELLERLLSSLSLLCEHLDHPDPARLQEVRRLDAQLASLQQQVEAGLAENAVLRIVGSPGDPWKIESLLTTSLPPGPSRLQLLAGAARVEGERLRTMTFPDVSGAPPSAFGWSPADWLRVRGMTRLERSLARLAMSQTGDADHVEAAADAPPFAELDAALGRLQELATSSNSSTDDAAALVADASDALRDFYARLPAWISVLAQSDEHLRDVQTRSAALRTLRVASRAMQHVDARDALRLPDANVAAALARCELFDQLAWQRDRALAAQDDAPPDEATMLAGLAQGYRQLAASIPGQPNPAADSRPQIHLDGPDTVSLSGGSEASFDLAVHNPDPRTVRLWVVLDYDPTVLDVTADAGNAVYPERASAAGVFREDPLGFRLRQEPATFELAPGGSAAMELTVRRQATPTRPVKLICKVLAVDTQQGSSACVRHAVGIDVPTRGAIELEIAGTPGSWTPAEGRATLHAFANRGTEFELRLRNRTSADQQLDVQIFGSDALHPPTLPSGAVSAGEAARALEGFAPVSVLVPGFPVTLPAGSPARGIPFPPPGKKPLADGGQSDGAAKLPAEAGAAEDKDQAAEAGGKPAARPLPRNLILVLTNQQTGRQTLHHLALTVQRPRRFLRPQVSYDPQRERIEIRLEPLAPGLLPPGKTRIHAELTGEIPTGWQAKLDAELTPESPVAVLDAPLPAAPERTATLLLSVDDYPRAFVYHVPCWSPATEVPEKTDLLQVRITGLPDGDTFKAPAGNIRVRFEVDAPHGAFETPEDVLYVGYDVDRDRELNREPRIALQADRQAELFLDGLSNDGRLTILSRVGDFEQVLPAVPVRSARLGVLAELAVAGRVSWSNPVELIVDDRPPRIEQPRLRPGPELPPGSEAELSVLASDDDLSGVAKVEATVDVEGTNEFGGANKPVAAKQDPESGTWLAKLPTAELPPGVHRVLVRATDKVENVGEVTNLNIRIMSAESAQSAGLNRVEGLVFYGQEPVAKAEVKLVPAEEGQRVSTTATSEQGAFEFAQVPPGKYTLSARGLLHNKYRTAETEIEVAPPPAPVALQELRLR